MITGAPFHIPADARARARMTCGATAATGHRSALYAIPQDAELVAGLVGWVIRAGEHIRCTDSSGCRRAMRVAYVEDRNPRTGERAECDARCMSSRGPSCSCECRGENHATGSAGAIIGGAL